MSLPNPGERPRQELERLEAAWQPPTGWRMPTAINNSYIGMYYVGAALLFFLLAGVMALLMRAQLAVPENDLLSEGLYNQLFTSHGTIMMFLFAVPAVEAMAILLLPNMLAARDMPFPRLSAYAFWAYFVGGLVFFGSIFFDMAPKGGWFMYPPLTSFEFSPDINPDFYLLGIGFIEISAIAGAIEIAVGILRTRAPGMTLARLPIFAWAMLVFAGMVVFAFPAVIAATALLELERAFHWPFFIAEKGGDPLLWQHLFWFFGHPEVYIIFLPAAGMVSMIVPTMAQTPLVAYRLVVLALLGTGFLSFGLWVHHMFTTGLPKLSLSFFSAASMAVAIPSGIQIFAWIATIASGRLRLTVPALFVLGFLFIFTLGGLTGVMVAMVPFDWQVHDTYFVVAHFHYVLIGGMVFPLFAAIYYWTPFVSRRPLSERLGRWAFALIFIGVNVAFFPMHIVGLIGMPRRVYTYSSLLGWDVYNLVSTIGAFTIAAGVVVFLVDMARNMRPTAESNAGNIWNAGTLEWIPTGNYGQRSIPIIASREPLWDQPGLSEDVEAGRYYLPGTITGGRETIITSAVTAQPQYITQLPQPGWPPFVAAVFTAAFFILLTFKLVVISLICGAVAMAGMVVWAWSIDRGPQGTADIGGRIELPVYRAGAGTHAGLAMGILLAVIGTIFACLVFSYLFLWTVNPGTWPPPARALPDLFSGGVSAALNLAAVLAFASSGSLLARSRGTGLALFLPCLAVGTVLLGGGFAMNFYGHWQGGLQPTAHSYDAVIAAIIGFQGLALFVSAVLFLYALARAVAGKLTAAHSGVFVVSRMFWIYTALQGLVALSIVHLFPRLSGG